MIATEAGVSPATVSKVMNNRHDVAPQTRARIQRLLARHGYLSQPGPRKPMTIDLVFDDLDSPRVPEILRGVVATGVETVVSSIDVQGSPQEWAHRMVSGARSGAILVTSDSAAERPTLDRAGLPYVIIDPVGPVAGSGPEAPSVGSTTWAGGLAATRHLLDLGHRRIAMICGPADSRRTRVRLDGYHAALRASGVPADPDLVRHAGLHHAGGYESARELLESPSPPTAILTGNDEQAVGVVAAARLLGIPVPTGLSVVGFDDQPVSRWVSPALTTVREPLAEMGRVAAGMLQALIAGRPIGTERVELATSLVVRDSTATPAARG